MCLFKSPRSRESPPSRAQHRSINDEAPLAEEFGIYRESFDLLLFGGRFMPSGYLHSCDIVCHKEVEFDEAWINVA